jgi:hypothetical protein
MFRNIWIAGALLGLLAGLSMAQPNGFAARGPAATKLTQAPPFLAPDSAAAKLMLATPEQREQFLKGLPPERQSRIREQLKWFDDLPEDVKQAQVARLRRFASLPKERKVEVRAQIQAFRALPQPRRQAVRRVLVTLSGLPEANRARRINAAAFRARFSEQELAIISELCEIWPVADR